MELPRPAYKSLICLARLREDMPGWDRILQAKEDALPLHNATTVSVAKGESTDIQKIRLGHLHELLFLERRWAYLRYMHLRHGFLMAGDVKSVLGIGVGRAYAELALAVEFPDVTFQLTDINAYAENAKRLVQEWNLDNVAFGEVNILEPMPVRYDFIESVEVLEHIEDHATAAANMQACARKAVFALVPFSDKAANADEALRKQECENHEHFRVGYDEDDLRAIFENVVHVQGCYWKDGGAKYRIRVTNLSDEEIPAKTHDLMSLAMLDERSSIPSNRDEAKGIWMLATNDPESKTHS